MENEKIMFTLTKGAIGLVTGALTGLSKSANSPHVKMVGSGLMNATAKFAHTTTKALKNHKGFQAAVGAGAVAVAAPVVSGAVAVGAAAMAAAPFVLGAAAIGGAAYGIYKLAEKGEPRQSVSDPNAMGSATSLRNEDDTSDNPSVR
jgi:hypothetical protein